MGEEEVHATEIFKKGNNLPHNVQLSDNIKSHHNTPEIRSSGEKSLISEERTNRKNIIKKFINTHCNSYIKKTIFKKRMYCLEENELKLKELSHLLNISVQRISVIEKNLKIKFKDFFSIESKKIEDIN